MTATAPGRVLRKQKSFRDCQIQNLDRLRSRNPHKKTKPTKLQDDFCLETNVDHLYFWMSSVASPLGQDERNPKENNADVLPAKLPPVFLVCTHADELYDGGDPRELAKMVFRHLKAKPYQGHLVSFFTVDNTKSGCGSECQGVVSLREAISVVVRDLPQMKSSVPTKWLRFEKTLQAAKEEVRTWIFFEEAGTIGCNECYVVDDQDIQSIIELSA
ncbi:hypothetical protein AWC38_SpisGene23148 [Stylophora pistillata]|uniref:Uncharacterized protein n=1 Tax=Stylophora pistillata TaxID=50429 RepID=A0A2B4R8Y9_STYPI|nr:hypothetical protein AWC38_SpisGene23148 [Stylophora pistillata]